MNRTDTKRASAAIPGLVAIAAITLGSTTDVLANDECGGLNQRVCMKWEQLRGCDPGLHRTSPVGGKCTYDNKLIPDPIEDIISPAPKPAPQPKPKPPVAEAPPVTAPGYVTPPPRGKKGTLPHLSAVPPTQPTAMDGLWKLNVNGIPYRIEAGRVYAMAEYKHLFVFPVEAHDVVVKDVIQTAPGMLSGYDMALLGPWTARLQPDGTIAITVQGTLGPFNGVLTQIQADNPGWLAQEIASLGWGGSPMPRPPTQPPGGYPAPPTAPPPSDGDGFVYPPGWGS